MLAVARPALAAVLFLLLPYKSPEVLAVHRLRKPYPLLPKAFSQFLDSLLELSVPYKLLEIGLLHAFLNHIGILQLRSSEFAVGIASLFLNSEVGCLVECTLHNIGLYFLDALQLFRSVRLKHTCSKDGSDGAAVFGMERGMKSPRPSSFDEMSPVELLRCTLYLLVGFCVGYLPDGRAGILGRSQYTILYVASLLPRFDRIIQTREQPVSWLLLTPQILHPEHAGLLGVALQLRRYIVLVLSVA